MEDFDGVGEGNSSSMGEDNASSSDSQSENSVADDSLAQSQESSDVDVAGEEKEEEAAASSEETEKQTRTDWRGEHFKYKKTVEPQLQELAGLREKVAELTDSQQQGVLIDRPSQEWEPLEQIKGLPEKYQQKMLDTVFDNFLPTFAQGVLSNPSQFPEQYQQLESVAINFATQAYERPVAEINAIMALTQGISAQRLEQLLLSGGNQQSTGAGAYQSPYPTAQPNLPNQQIYQLASQAGLDLEDPSQQAFVNSLAQMQAGYQRQLSSLETKLSKFEGEQAKASQQTKQQSVEQLKAKVDEQANSVRQELLVSVTKDRVTKDDTATPTKIRERAEYRLMRDEKANTALASARDYASDGFDKGVRGQMRLYAARAAAIYNEVAKDELGVKVSQTSSLRQSDQQKAARKDIATGAANANTNNGNSIDDWLKGAKIDTRNAGDLAAELSQRARQ
jgi:hypothetical protein